MKQRYFRLPWHRHRLSQRSLWRLLLTELEDPEDCLTDRRAKRLEAKRQLKLILKEVA